MHFSGAVAISPADGKPQRAEAEPCALEGSMGWICRPLGWPSSMVPGERTLQWDLGLGIFCPCPVRHLQALTNGPAPLSLQELNPRRYSQHRLSQLLKGSHLLLDTKHFLPCLAGEKFISKGVKGMATQGSFGDRHQARGKDVGGPGPSLCWSGSPSSCWERLWAMCLVGVPPTHPPSR